MNSIVNKIWLDEFLDKITQKLSRTSDEIGVKFPYTTKNGKFEEFAFNNDISWWTNGFWPGIMWLMYSLTRDEKYRKIAHSCEELLDEAFDNFEGIHHDVGFMWNPSSVANYLLTGNKKSKIRAMHAATILAGRFNINGSFIRAWEDYPDEDCTGWAIIDCLMNLPLLYWASKESGDVRFSAIAKAHTNTVIKSFVRSDFSVNHIVGFCPETGVVKVIPRGQGYASGSSWSRGQAWAIYGLTLGYMNTGETPYLSVAKNIADYFISKLDESFVPLVDFTAPKEPECRDTSAGAIAACGMIELSKLVNDGDKYLAAAVKILEGLEKNCDFTRNEQSILQNCTGAYHDVHHHSLIYGDYFLLEALMKLKGETINFWCIDKK